MPTTGVRAGYDGPKRPKGHIAVDTLGRFAGLVVLSANDLDRAQVEQLADAVQAATDETVELARMRRQAIPATRQLKPPQAHGISLSVVKLP